MDTFSAVNKNPSREPSRIQNILGALCNLWQGQPDFELMEVVSESHSSMAELGFESKSIWDTEDDVWLKLLQRQLLQRENVAENSLFVPLYHQGLQSLLSDVWTRFPDMRFGQLLCTVCRSILETSEFNSITDLELLQCLSSYEERTKNVVLMMVKLSELIPPPGSSTQE